jgi:hypothetical protein
MFQAEEIIQEKPTWVDLLAAPKKGSTAVPGLPKRI